MVSSAYVFETKIITLSKLTLIAVIDVAYFYYISCILLSVCNLQVYIFSSIIFCHFSSSRLHKIFFNLEKKVTKIYSSTSSVFQSYLKKSILTEVTIFTSFWVKIVKSLPRCVNFTPTLWQTPTETAYTTFFVFYAS